MILTEDSNAIYQLSKLLFLSLLITQLVNAKDLSSIDTEGLKKAALAQRPLQGLVPIQEEPMFMGISCNPISRVKPLRCSARLSVLIEDMCDTNVMVSGSRKVEGEYLVSRC